LGRKGSPGDSHGGYRHGGLGRFGEVGWVVPLTRLLRGEEKPVPAYHSLGMAGPDGAVQEAAESIELGFRCVKFKVGYPHVEQDRAVIGAARGAAGKDLQVMVDYNQSLSVPEAIGRVQLLEEEALVWVEEPTRADDFAGHARIAAECRTPIQIGENLWEPHDLIKSLSVCASDFVMLDVMKIGGITSWLRAVSQTRPVYQFRVIYCRNSARSCWRFHRMRIGWNTRIGRHRS